MPARSSGSSWSSAARWSRRDSSLGPRSNVQRDVVVDEHLDEQVEVAHVAADEDCHTPFALT
ncbi:hypothetical protein GCM10009788_59380 [Nocardioides humi]|uniref:Uncharacterized protein n=1 Tax=Nocardioides humi TaxID=449461 RepID=A0ABN2C0Z0_9ACTN